MKNFDQKRSERNVRREEFVIGGEQFILKSGVRPEALLAYDDLNDDSPVGDVLSLVDEVVQAFIEEDDDAHARWRRLRERNSDPLTLEDLQDLVQWLVEAATGRPTGQPSVSTGGSTKNGTTTLSTVRSSPQAVPEPIS